MKDRTILHCDLNNFFASVECTLNPALADEFVAVCGNKEHRHGVVLAKNQNAKNAGVKTGETIAEAQKKCANLVVVSPHYEEYVNYAKKVQNIYKQYTDKVESFGLDECWLDVTESLKLFGDGKKIADELREKVKQSTGLTISVGVSFCKVFAKLGSDLKKPDATTVIDKNNYKSVVWELPATDMLMVGRQTQKKLTKYNINTIGDLAKADEKMLKYVFGVNGVKIKNCAAGNDDSPVSYCDVALPVKSVGHSTTTVVDICEYQTAKQVLWFLSDMVAMRLRKYGLKANGVSVSIRYNNLDFAGKQAKIPLPSFDGNEIAQKAFELLKELWRGQTDTPLRLLGVSTFDLIPVSADVQENLFDTPKRDKADTLSFTVDKIRKKYGYNSVKKAVTLNNDVMTDKSPIEDTDFLPFKKLS